MRLVPIFAMFVGCGGDGSDAPTDLTLESGATTDGVCDVPHFDLEGMDCGQIRNAFDTSLDAADRCTTPADCHVVVPACPLMGVLAYCFFAANDCFGASDLAGFEDAAAALPAGCGSTPGTSVCTCGPAPGVGCVDGNCVVE